MMNPFRAFLCALLLVLAAPAAYAAQCEPAKVAQDYPGYATKTVTIAASPTDQPFAYSDPANPGRLDGLEVEMIEKAMACAGLKYRFSKGAWSALLPALFSGAADVMIGSVNYTPERATRADFILYMRAGQSIVVAKGNPKHITSMGDLCGKIGSTDAVGTSAQAIKQQSKMCTDQGKPAIDFRPATDSDASFRELINGRVDFVIDDTPAVAVRLKKEPGLQIAATVVTDILSGMVVPKGNKEMLQAVANGLRIEQKDGTLAKLASKFGLDPKLLIPIEVRR